MKPFTAGLLDRRITLQARAVSRDSATGAEVATWSDSATVWAQVLESSTAPTPGSMGRGQAGGEIAVYARPHRLRIRWREVDKATTRVSYDGRILRITGTAEIGRREGLELACEEWAHE